MTASCSLPILLLPEDGFFLVQGEPTVRVIGLGWDYTGVPMALEPLLLGGEYFHNVGFTC